ncbi:MAG: SDR family NAD(P)-dependent oxidoreductase [Bacteroidales bacterium]|nr:SDR family NAD(P)-dependent oxidoreductase [Bacteroidales bacterium]
MSKNVENERLGFWNGKRVLVTGAAGFIGSHLCEKLVLSGSRVSAFIRYNSVNSFGLLEGLNNDILSSIKIISGDILDESSIIKATQEVEIIYHLAALPGIPYSFTNPRHVFMVNTGGTFNILQAARSSGVRHVILASSAGASEKRPISSPYIMSKAAMEKIGLGFHQALDLPVSVMRLLNNYGPRQSARAVIPTIISQALVGKDVRLGALEPKMDFNYVSDTINALMLLEEKAEIQGKVYTWGTGVNTSIKDLAEIIFALIDSEGRNIVSDESRIRNQAGAVASLEEDILATQRDLSYTPQYDLQKGLKETIEWFSENLNQYKTDNYVV